MSTLKDMRRLLAPPRQDDTGSVVELLPGGRVMVRNAQRVVVCTSLVPLSVGDAVKVQGSLIVSRQVAPADSLPEYRV